MAGIEGQTGQIAYSSTKGGIIGMTLPAARDLSAIGVRSTRLPRIIDTPIYGSAKGPKSGRRKLSSPRSSSPERISQADKFDHLVQILIKDVCMDAKVVRFDSRIRVPAQVYNS